MSSTRQSNVVQTQEKHKPSVTEKIKDQLSEVVQKGKETLGLSKKSKIPVDDQTLSKNLSKNQDDEHLQIEKSNEPEDVKKAQLLNLETKQRIDHVEDVPPPPRHIGEKVDEEGSEVKNIPLNEPIKPAQKSDLGGEDAKSLDDDDYYTNKPIRAKVAKTMAETKTTLSNFRDAIVDEVRRHEHQGSEANYEDVKNTFKEQLSKESLQNQLEKSHNATIGRNRRLATERDADMEQVAEHFGKLNPNQTTENE